MSPAPAKAKAGLWLRIGGWTYGPTIGVTLLVGAAFNLWLLPLLDFAGPKATFLAATLGLLVGVVELVKRYRDEPVNAVLSPWGLIYLLVNALISLVALYLVYLFPAVFGGLAQNKPLAALAAGAGAAAIMRTRIALFKGADGKDLALPLDYLINELLSLADKHIDRHRAPNAANWWSGTWRTSASSAPSRRRPTTCWPRCSPSNATRKNNGRSSIS